MECLPVPISPIVTEARHWIGTPFHHQGRLRGVGVDCVGLVIGICESLNLHSRALDKKGRKVPFTALDEQGYAPEPQGNLLRTKLDAFLEPIPADSMKPGDIALFVMARHPQHVAIIGDYPGGGLSLIHAYSPRGGVCEHGYNEKWQRRIVSAYRFYKDAFEG